MTRKPNAKLKFNPARGRMPVLQNIPCIELKVDHAYQRATDAATSQALIARIARDWDWSMCQPLVVAERAGDDAALYVIDGQHRLTAAKLRGDIYGLPCVVIRTNNIADEAAMFRQMNGDRQPLTKLDLFKAALASGDPAAREISAALAAASLKLAPHTNNASWGPGVVGNIGGLTKAWRTPGPAATSLALYVLGAAYRGEPLRQCGTLFPGILAICADELKKKQHADSQQRIDRHAHRNVGRNTAKRLDQPDHAPARRQSRHAIRAGLTADLPRRLGRTDGRVHGRGCLI